PDFRGRRTASQVFASLDEERGSDPWLQTGAPVEPGQRGESVERRGPLLIGIVSAMPDLPQVMHPFFGPVLAGIKARLVQARCDLLVPTYKPASPTGEDPRAIERCFAYGASGVIVMGIDATQPDFAPLLESGRPIVLVDGRAMGGRVGYVMSDNVEGAASTVRHLFKLGRRRIATITGLMPTLPASDRLFGYRSELSRLGLDQRPEYVVEGDFYHGTGYQRTRQLLALPEPPDAIVAASDMMAVGAIVAIEEAELRVPEDIAVVGYDDSPFAAAMWPALTTIRQDALGLGMAAADSVLAMLDNPDFPPPTVIFPTELVIRESCGIELLRKSSTY
ncbi:MAG TPA: substrate-binding domain-containing protein, partial [Gaiellaceae bacterium]